MFPWNRLLGGNLFRFLITIRNWTPQVLQGICIFVCISNFTILPQYSNSDGFLNYHPIARFLEIEFNLCCLEYHFLCNIIYCPSCVMTLKKSVPMWMRSLIWSVHSDCHQHQNLRWRSCLLLRQCHQWRMQGCTNDQPGYMWIHTFLTSWLHHPQSSMTWRPFVFQTFSIVDWAWKCFMQVTRY